MVKVHIWMPDNQHVGHTALTIGSDYISFWPDGSAAKKDIKIKTSQPGAFMADLSEDIRNEGNRQPITIAINNLDEEKILDYIEELRFNKPRYQLARHNCSHVVANCLQAGASKPSFTPNASAYHSLGKVLGRGVWTPDQVLKYARELT